MAKKNTPRVARTPATDKPNPIKEVRTFVVEHHLISVHGQQWALGESITSEQIAKDGPDAEPHLLSRGAIKLVSTDRR